MASIWDDRLAEVWAPPRAPSFCESVSFAT
jgi:hypothetical protein